jgi:hypothetical protein
MESFANVVRKIGDERYPRILNLLESQPSNTHISFDIVFKRTIDLDTNKPNAILTTAETRGTTIFLNSSYYSQKPKEIEVDLVHEMAHVVLAYSHSVPEYWGEGMALYVCFKLGYTNAITQAQCTRLCPHYMSGLSCAGAFLLYIDQSYGFRVIRELNQHFRRGTYNDAFFLKATGKPLELLWSNFQQTPFFTEEAKDVLAFEEALGYVNRKPPADVMNRVFPYLKARPAGRLSFAALSYCHRLCDVGKLPGVGKENENDGISINLDIWDWVNASKPEVYPASRTLQLNKEGDPSDYYYTLVRDAKDTPWHLKRAYRSLKGKLVEEFSITDDDDGGSAN